MIVRFNLTIDLGAFARGFDVSTNAWNKLSPIRQGGIGKRVLIVRPSNRPTWKKLGATIERGHW